MELLGHRVTDGKSRRPAGRRSTRSPLRLARVELIRKAARLVTRARMTGACWQDWNHPADARHLEATDEPQQEPHRSRQRLRCVDAGRAVCPRAASLALAPFNFGANCALLAAQVPRSSVSCK
jgi:hypothetical protein